MTISDLELAKLFARFPNQWRNDAKLPAASSATSATRDSLLALLERALRPLVDPAAPVWIQGIAKDWNEKLEAEVIGGANWMSLRQRLSELRSQFAAQVSPTWERIIEFEKSVRELLFECDGSLTELLVPTGAREIGPTDASSLEQRRVAVCRFIDWLIAIKQ